MQTDALAVHPPLGASFRSLSHGPGAPSEHPALPFSCQCQGTDALSIVRHWAHLQASQLAQGVMAFPAPFILFFFS